MPQPKVELTGASGYKVDVTDSNRLMVDLAEQITVSIDTSDAIEVVQDTAGDLNATVNLITGFALETGGNLDTISGDTTSIDGKITACNTGAVVVSSGAITETNSGTIAGDTTSIDGKITACNTGAVVVSSGAITETNSGTIAGDTTSIDGKITACNTGAVVVSTMPSEVLIAGGATQTNDVKVTLDGESVAVTGTVGHNITGMVSDRNIDVGTTAEQLNGATDDSMDVACKRVDLQTSYDNTGFILVGDSGLLGNLSGGGIKLFAGDFYSIDIDNVGDIYVLAEVANEDIYYTYYT